MGWDGMGWEGKIINDKSTDGGFRCVCFSLVKDGFGSAVEGHEGVIYVCLRI